MLNYQRAIINNDFLIVRLPIRQTGRFEFFLLFWPLLSGKTLDYVGIPELGQAFLRR